MIKLTAGPKWYLFGRALATTASLIFAFYYSKELGVLSRSYLVLIMTSSVLIGISLSSGTTLTLRNLSVEKISRVNISSFNSLIVIQALIGVALLLGTLLAFSNLKLYLHPTLVASALVYFVSSLAHLVVFELLISFGAFRMLAAVELLTVSIQFCIYFFLRSFFSFSTAINLIFALMLSYFLVVSMCLKYLSVKFEYPIIFGDPKVFFRQTRGNHMLGTILTIVDRSDRLIIAWFLPITLLAKYAIMSSSIAFFRFIPEALGKLIISGKLNILFKPSQRKLLFLGVVAFMICSVFLLQSLIGYFLGPQWLLPLGVTFVFALQELARGAFQLTANSRVSRGNSSSAHNASILLLLFSYPLALTLASAYGIIGVPLGFLVSYLLVLQIMRLGGKSV